MPMSMARLALLALAALLLVAAPAQGQESCRLCLGDSAAGESGERALGIEIWADLNFSRLALNGQSGGSAVVDPASGTKRTGGGMLDLGGMPVTGRGRITGTPLREVHIDLPQRVVMTTPDGAEGELASFTTDLPPHPALDANGQLEFTFGARLVISGGRGGNFRGRIPISVDYN